MAHELTKKANGEFAMAYLGETPWHKKGQLMWQGATRRDWTVHSGLDFKVQAQPMNFVSDDGQLIPVDGKRVLVRSDNRFQLSVVSDSYQVVQPAQVMNSMFSIIDALGYSIHTAGSLFEGRKIWVLAKTGVEQEVIANDPIKTYLLITTGFDGDTATEARFAVERVVCQNTLNIALGEDSRNVLMRVPHNSRFEHDQLMERLGRVNAQRQTNRLLEKFKHYANRPVTQQVAQQATIELLKRMQLHYQDVTKSSHYQSIMSLFGGRAIGSDIDQVKGSGWGFLNAVTERVDRHWAPKAKDSVMSRRFANTLFGEGDRMKQTAMAVLDKVLV